MTQPDPLDARSAQEQREERGERITLADLSAVEKEALALLREDEPRHWFTILAAADVTPELRQSVPTRGVLLRHGLMERMPTLLGFYRLTAEGLRLQAELFAEDGE